MKKKTVYLHFLKNDSFLFIFFEHYSFCSYFLKTSAVSLQFVCKLDIGHLPKVAMIGSGATSITILPSIANVASHVTMVQRTASYIAALPKVDPLAQFFNDWLPESIAVRLNRYKACVIGSTLLPIL